MPLGRQERVAKGTMRPRILFFDGDLIGHGGAQRSNLYLATFLHEQGYPIALLHGNDGDLIDAWRDVAQKNFALGSVRLPRRHPVLSAIRIQRALRFSHSWQPDIVYCYSFDQLPMAAVVARSCSVPILYHMRTPMPKASRRNRRRMRLPAEFLAVSHSTQKEYSALLPDLSTRCTVVHNGVDLTEFTPISSSTRTETRAAFGIPIGDRVIGFFGRVSPDKGLMELVKAHSRIAVDMPTCLVVVGTSSDARERAFEESIRLSCAAEQVIFLGYQKAVAALMGSVDVIAMPSHEESFGRVAIEGLACGTPVVATRVGGLPEILEEDFPDNLVPVADDNALEKALRRVITRRPTASEEARFRACAEGFDLERIHVQIERVIRRVAA